MKDKLNRILDNLEKIIGTLFLSFLGMVSYLFVNIEKLSSFKFATLLIGMVLSVVIIAVLSMIYLQKLDELDKKKEQ